MPLNLSTVAQQLDDDELAARAKEESLARYPEEYRLRAQGQDPAGSLDFDLSSRVVLPSEVGPGGSSILHDHVPATRLKVRYIFSYQQLLS